jgi:hypothetical protein
VIRVDRTSAINMLLPLASSVLQRLGVNYPTSKSCFLLSVTISRIPSTGTTPQIPEELNYYRWMR